MPENNGNLRWLRKKALIQTSGGNPVYVREGVLYDRTGHIILSVRGDMMDAVEEGNLYCFTQVTLKNYLGKKLTTSKMSVTTVHKSTQDFPTLDEVVFKSYLEEEEIKKMVKPKLSYPKLLNIGLDIFPGCTNKQCNKPLNLLPGAKIVRCHHCSRTMRADKCRFVFHCVMSFEDKMSTLPIEVFPHF